MDDNKVVVLLENLSSQFKVFGEGLEIVQKQVSEVNQKVDGLERRFDKLELKVDSLERRFDSLEKKVDGLERRFDGLEKKVDGLIEDMVKPALVKINNRLDTIEGEIIKLNPDSKAVFVKQAK